MKQIAEQSVHCTLSIFYLFAVIFKSQSLSICSHFSLVPNTIRGIFIVVAGPKFGLFCKRVGDKVMKPEGEVAKRWMEREQVVAE